ncbi:MAG: hypothetical protein ABIK28_08110, partial [Planctomycetota bacterium]
MKLSRFACLFLVLTALSLFTGCWSRNNVADLFPPYDRNNPEEEGWDPNEDGTFSLHTMEPGTILSVAAPDLVA